MRGNVLLVLHFNDFTGVLQDAVLMHKGGHHDRMSAAKALDYLLANPRTQCDPLRV